MSAYGSTFELEAPVAATELPAPERASKRSVAFTVGILCAVALTTAAVHRVSTSTSSVTQEGEFDYAYSSESVPAPSALDPKSEAPSILPEEETPSPNLSPTAKPTSSVVTYSSGTYGDASCSDNYAPWTEITYGNCVATLYASARDDTDGSDCQVYESTVSAIEDGSMTVGWVDSSTGQDDDCNMEIEVSTGWSVATSDEGTMTLSLTLNMDDYSAGAEQSLYGGFELDDVTYEVTDGGYEEYTITYTDCLDR